jgi:hypothetical protein
VLAPARELAKQHAENIAFFSDHLEAGGLPPLRVACCIGGEDLRTQMAPFDKGCHVVVATPGRLKDHLSKRRFTLDLCKCLVLDEGDRMLDMGFDEDIKLILSFFKAQRQTIIYSATMPAKIKDFAREALVRPVVVNVGRAGAANMDVVQEVEYVRSEARVVYLLQCLTKTAPPVLVFAENKRDVDDIQEYLLLKGVARCAAKLCAKKKLVSLEAAVRSAAPAQKEGKKKQKRKAKGGEGAEGGGEERVTYAVPLGLALAGVPARSNGAELHLVGNSFSIRAQAHVYEELNMLATLGSAHVELKPEHLALAEADGVFECVRGPPPPPSAPARSGPSPTHTHTHTHAHTLPPLAQG